MPHEKISQQRSKLNAIYPAWCVIIWAVWPAILQWSPQNFFRFGVCRPPSLSVLLPRSAPDAGSTNKWRGHRLAFQQGLKFPGYTAEAGYLFLRRLFSAARRKPAGHYMRVCGSSGLACKGLKWRAALLKVFAELFPKKATIFSF